jgi:hypothetical protein
MAQQDDFLYHYTTLDAFVSIVKTQEIWASNVFYLNDSAEVHLALRLAQGLLKEEIEKKSSDLPARRLKKLYESLSDKSSGLIEMPAFVWSLSKKEDDLSQWRAYCREGGVAIGFRQNDLDYLRQHQGLGLAPELVPCIYEKGEQRRLIRSWIEKVITTVSGGRLGRSISAHEVDKFTGMLLQRILVNKPIKHEAFADEREWRLIASPDLGMTADERLGFRSHNGLVIPFWKFNLAPHNEGRGEPDRRIWKNVRVIAGPSPHPDELKGAIEGMLKRYCGHGGMASVGDVWKSSVPFRYW